MVATWCMAHTKIDAMEAVQGAGAHAQLAPGARFHILDDGVPVPVLVDQRQENVKGGRRERQELGDAVGFGRHEQPL